MGIIYVCESITTKGILKIGIADNEALMKERFRSHRLDGYRAQQFEPFVAIDTPKYKKFEQVFKKVFSKSRILDSELYVIAKDDIVAFLALIADKVVYDEKGAFKQEEIEDETEALVAPKTQSSGIKKAPKIKRSTLGIEYGAKLIFCKTNGTPILDNEGKEIVAKNIDDDVIEYEGNTASITATAQKFRKEILKKEGSISGNDWFSYNGDTLTKLAKARGIIK
jgi:hypothetical protein